MSEFERKHIASHYPYCPLSTPDTKVEEFDKDFNKELLCDCDGNDINGGYAEGAHTISNPKDIKEFILKWKSKWLAEEREKYEEMPCNYCINNRKVGTLEERERILNIIHKLKAQ